MTRGSLQSGVRHFVVAHHWISYIFKCLGAISLVGQTEILNKTNEVPGISRIGDDLLLSCEATRRSGSCETFRESLHVFCGVVTYHELKEATMIIELSRWKGKLEGERASSSESRGACCVEFPGPVKDAILQYISCNRG